MRKGVLYCDVYVWGQIWHLVPELGTRAVRQGCGAPAVVVTEWQVLGRSGRWLTHRAAKCRRHLDPSWEAWVTRQSDVRHIRNIPIGEPA
jgi:hypothetical protein